MRQNFKKCEQIETILEVFKKVNNQHVCLQTNKHQHIAMTTKQQQQHLNDSSKQTDRHKHT